MSNLLLIYIVCPILVVNTDLFATIHDPELNPSNVHLNVSFVTDFRPFMGTFLGILHALATDTLLACPCLSCSQELGNLHGPGSLLEQCCNSGNRGH